MAERKQPNRRRCLTAGCNPVLHGQDQADDHTTATGHRTAKWPVRSPEGRRRANVRNQTGYYDRYNTGTKSAEARWLTPGVRGGYPSGAGLPAMDEGWDDHKGAW
jgi:hypothetical protein